MLFAPIIKAAAVASSLLATLAAAAPIAEPAEDCDLGKRQMLTPNTTQYQGPTVADSPSLQQLILDRHNMHRMLHHAPNLTWSDELASNSQQFTNMCVAGEGWASLSPNHGSNTMNSGFVSEPTYEQATIDSIRAWASEASQVTYNPFSCKGVCGHFTQMIWKSTTKVGCSWNTKKCNNLVVFQCYYDPAGNNMGAMDANVLPH